MSADIIARLEKATGPDRELDGLIALATGALNVIVEWRYRPGDGRARKLEPFTASLDAALALVGERLPGWEIVIRIERDEKFANMWAPGSDPNFGGECFYSYAATPQIAVLLSMFRALETA